MNGEQGAPTPKPIASQINQRIEMRCPLWL
jgi:hypothetical protein